ncbi:hypothetical protein Q3A66_02730 [Hymenobacter sp. BT770]|uniref:hypothetical protein n=1 Tax=Hymenobacter sp. BT770 TaxID=2886942 RepID=UPI001D1013C5|nr:hypothetical protein [Hymenobacter sp. BT770]MCC3151454.1 hypothetical protein [Hymenobacter sp. BT770]MDO3413970.1 hypothetical protein [Hymenobacter sp. BT770]
MNDKYSLAKCAQYGRRLAARLCEQHFGAQPTATLDGPAVLKFTPVRQVNLLVVRQLLGQWQAETARLRSPYFDFEAAPVQAALTQFMNVLSRHISLGRAAFEPLLAQAVADTLGIVADPVHSFQHLLLGNAESFTLSGLRDNLRYIDVDKAFYQGFVDSLPASSELSGDFLSHRFELYHAANYKGHQPMQRLVTELSALLPLTTADLLEDGPVSAISTPAAPAPEAAPAAPAKAPEPTPVAVPTFVASSAPVAPSQPVTAAPATPAVPEPVAARAVPTPATPARPLPHTETASVPLHEKLKAGQPAAAPLAETLRATATSAQLAERPGPKVESLREAISINQRFSFINELFNGENMEYHAAIQHLDSLPTADQARAYVTGDLSQRYDWNRKEEHVNKLLKLIERKFA